MKTTLLPLTAGLALSIAACALASAALAGEERPPTPVQPSSQADRAPREAESQSTPVSTPAGPVSPATEAIEILTAPLDMPIGDQPQRRFPRYG